MCSFEAKWLFLAIAYIKKQLKKFQELCSLPCALCLDNLSALQRRSMLEEHIPFVSLSQQVYLPFWGCAFHEQFKADAAIMAKWHPVHSLYFYIYTMQRILGP